MFYLTYVLRSQADRNLYVGYTENLERRLQAHHDGKVKSTQNRRPLVLIYYEACLNKEDALKRERYFKTNYGRMFLKKRLKSHFTG